MAPTARQAEPQPQTAGQARSRAFAPAVAGAAILIAGLVGFAAWRTGESRAAFPAAATPVAIAQRAAASPAAGPHQPGTITVTSEQFLEAAQAGRVAYSGGDYARAAELYEEGIAKRPQDAEAWSNLGQALVKLDRAEESIEKFQRAIELNPDRWTYHFNLGRAQGLTGNWEAAVAAYRAAERLFPDDYATAFNLGLALKKAGDDAGAVDAFKRAIALDPQEPTFHFSLAGTYEKLGQTADAVTEYQRTLDLAGAAPEAPAIQARIARLKGEPPRPAATAPVAPLKEPAPASGSDR